VEVASRPRDRSFRPFDRTVKGLPQGLTISAAVILVSVHTRKNCL
jgi:hypothetical protein